MDEAKHTPGPWATWESPEMRAKGVTGPSAAATMFLERQIKEQGYAPCVEVPALVGKVAALAIAETLDEAKANARLIAAAPELLEACEAALEAFFSSSIRFSHENVERIQQLRAAIAKATGSAS